MGVLNDFTFVLMSFFVELHTSGMISDEEHAYLKLLSKKRYEVLYGDAHGLGYLLDPRFIVERLSLHLRDHL